MQSFITWSCLGSDRGFLCVRRQLPGRRCWAEILTFCWLCLEAQRAVGLHAWLVLTQRLRELAVWNQQKVGVRDFSDERHGQWGQVISAPRHAQLEGLCSMHVWAQNTPALGSWEDLWTLYCKQLRKGRPLSSFSLWALHCFFPLSLEVLPEQRMDIPIKTWDSCVKGGGEAFFQKGSSDVSAQGNSGSKGHTDFSNKSIFKRESLTLWSLLENDLQMAHPSTVWLLPATVSIRRVRSLEALQAEYLCSDLVNEHITETTS